MEIDVLVSRPRKVCQSNEQVREWSLRRKQPGERNGGQVTWDRQVRKMWKWWPACETNLTAASPPTLPSFLLSFPLLQPRLFPSSFLFVSLSLPSLTFPIPSFSSLPLSVLTPHLVIFLPFLSFSLSCPSSILSFPSLSFSFPCRPSPTLVFFFL